MVGFPDLPPEVLLHIWTYIRSTDIDSFALISRNVRALGTKQLTELEYLKKKYSTIWGNPEGKTCMYLKKNADPGSLKAGI